MGRRGQEKTWVAIADYKPLTHSNYEKVIQAFHAPPNLPLELPQESSHISPHGSLKPLHLDAHDEPYDKPSDMGKPCDIRMTLHA